MYRIAVVIAAVILAFSSSGALGLCEDNQILHLNGGSKNVIVEIDYGGLRPSRTVEVPWVKDRTALEVLQTVAKVETHPVGQYVFVISIDDVEGKRGEMAWYYTVNGKSADKLAYSNTVNDACQIRWVYKKDVCSKKVDGEI